MDFLTFILVFVSFLIFGSLAISGWFFVTRGELKVLEDGRKVRKGKIFSGWYFFWAKKKSTKKKVYFDETHAYELYLKIRQQYQSRELYANITTNGVTIKISNWKKFEEEIKWIEGAFNVKFYHSHDDVFFVYREYDEYVFPSYVRDPIAVCATCFSSVYGSAFYWLLIALIKQNLFAWASNSALAAVFFWITFCLSLSVLNTALAKRWN